MGGRRRSSLEGLPLARTAAVGGALAGAAGALLAALLVTARSLLHGLEAAAGLAARGALIGADRAWAGAALLLGIGLAVGALVGWRVGVRSGIEHLLRGLAVGLALWCAGRIALPRIAPALWADPLAPRLPEYLAFGAALGLQARVCRALLRRQWRRRVLALRAGAPRATASSSARLPARSR